MSALFLNIRLKISIMQIKSKVSITLSPISVQDFKVTNYSKVKEMNKSPFR